MTSARMMQRRDTAANWTSTNPTLGAGEIGVESDSGAFKIGDGVAAWTALPYVPRIVDFASAVRTAGDLSFATANVWANVSTTLDLVLTGVKAGDLVEFVPSFLVNAAANTLVLDVCTLVGGNPVSYFGTAGGASDNGVCGWYCGSGQYTGAQGPAFYFLASGDISGGTVTLRLRVKVANATARVIAATAPSPCRVSARAYRGVS